MNDQRAPRLYHDGPLNPGATIELPERAARHAQALRLRNGDAIVLFNGDGSQWSATLLIQGRRAFQARLGERQEVDRESPLGIRLLQGVCGSDRMDWLLQKATELGVSEIQPLLTSRSIVRLSSERQERRLAHWQNVAIAACEQCGRNRIPPVHESLDLPTYLSRPHTGALRLVLNPAGERRLRELEPRQDVEILIGPEGGLAPEEVDMAVNSGFTSVRIGPRILRTETAPLAALAALQAAWGDC